MRLEKLFKVFQCMGKHSVYPATNIFRGLVEDWWRITQTTYEHIEDGVAWATFMCQFMKKFIPYHMRGQKFREFGQLVQGEMTVQGYELRFTQLSKFVRFPYHMSWREPNILLTYSGGHTKGGR